MKKVFLSMFAAATMLFGTSCSEDQLVSDNAGDEAVVSFTLNLSDGIQTKAISDGTTVDDLVYCVYDKDGNKIDALSETKKGAFADDALTTTVNFTLVKGQTYSFSFWAQDENAPYTHNGKTVTVNYENATTTANDENRDAFYAVVKDYTVTNSFEQNVTLTRPFAQLNYLVTSDELTAASKAGFVPYQSKITLKNVATTLNMFDATVSGSEEVTFDLAAIPAETELTKVKKLNEEEWVVFDQATGAVTYTETQSEATDFRYLATTYLLVNAPGTAANDGKVKSTLESTSMTVVEEGGSEPLSLSIPNVPVQWNYRTNIFGSLLTANGKFYIEIDPAYEEDSDYTVNVWDGATETEPETDASGAYIVSSASEFAWLGNNFFSGQGLENVTINIVNSIDMNGGTFNNLMLSGTSVINGNNNVISNVNFVECPYADGTNSGHNGQAAGAAFVYVPSGATVTINDLTFTQAHAQGVMHSHGSGGAGIVATYVQGTLNLNNVHVKDSKVEGVYSLGGLIGEVTAGTTTLKDCSVNGLEIANTEVSGESGLLGGAIGRVIGTTVVETISVENVAIKAYIGEASLKRSVGRVVGNIRETSGNLSMKDVTCNTSNVIITLLSTGMDSYVNAKDDYVGGIYENGTYTLDEETK